MVDVARFLYVFFILVNLNIVQHYQLFSPEIIEAKHFSSSHPCRQLALKALNERLKRVEDQSAWPSMDDEEDDDDDEVRTDTQPLLPSGREPSSTPRTAGGAISASLSSTSSSLMSQSGGAPSSGGVQHPESSIISFEDAPSRS